MSSEFQILDTLVKHKNKAKQVIAEKIESDKSAFGTDDRTGTFAEKSKSAIVFDDKEFTSKDDAIAYLRENANNKVLVVKLTSQTLTKLQLQKINTIRRNSEGYINTTRERAIKRQEDLSSCIANTLTKIRLAKKRQPCNFCNSLIPTTHLDSHTCPVCKEDGAFLTDQAAHSIQIRKERYEAAKAKLDELVLNRDTKIAAVEKENKKTVTTWFAGCHCEV